MNYEAHKYRIDIEFWSIVSISYTWDELQYYRAVSCKARKAGF